MIKTSLSTIIGDQIEKFSQPKYPIYRIEYIETTAKMMFRDYMTMETTHRSIVGELIPLNDEDNKMISKYDEFKKKNPEKAKGDWLDNIYVKDFDKLKLPDYLSNIRNEGVMHLKLFRYLQRATDTYKNKKKPLIYKAAWSEDADEAEIEQSIVLVNVERIG